jgi:hypothetical protein
MKHLRCSECGVPLEFTIKATSQLSEKIIYLIKPHSCDEMKSLAEIQSQLLLLVSSYKNWMN